MQMLITTAGSNYGSSGVQAFKGITNLKAFFIGSRSMYHVVRTFIYKRHLSIKDIHLAGTFVYKRR